VNKTRTIGVIQLIIRYSDQMRVDVGCVHHGGNNVFESPGTQKAEVHLKLVLGKIRKSGSGV
jgi:hypothetical protein